MMGTELDERLCDLADATPLDRGRLGRLGSGVDRRFGVGALLPISVSSLL
jgi:hypothetical protein